MKSCSLSALSLSPSSWHQITLVQSKTFTTRYTSFSDTIQFPSLSYSHQMFLKYHQQTIKQILHSVHTIHSHNKSFSESIRDNSSINNSRALDKSSLVRSKPFCGILYSNSMRIFRTCLTSGRRFTSATNTLEMNDLNRSATNHFVQNFSLQGRSENCSKW